MSMGTVEAVTVELFRITGRLELLLEKIDPDNHSLTNDTLGWIGDIKEDCEGARERRSVVRIHVLVGGETRPP